jgi:8-oxo-dGTP pyrophosphatase MutT (NUDIX family)
MKLVTILFLRKENQVLLAMKKRGFGVGKWNGVGGKAAPGEDETEAAIRECQEEIGVTAIGPKLIGKIKFSEKTDPNFGHHAHIFVATKWLGEPVETEEMRPQWFDIQNIPYHQMWVDDKLWLPLMLAGKRFEAEITLDGDKIVSHDIQIV